MCSRILAPKSVNLSPTPRLKVLDQFFGVRREVLEAPHADHQVSHGPTISELDDLNHKPLLMMQDRSGYDGNADAALDHTADGVEAAQPYAKLQIPARSRRMLTDVQLQRIRNLQSDELLIKYLAEREPATTPERVAFWHDQNETIGRKRKALYFRDVDQIRNNANIGQTGGNGGHDFM